MYSVITAKGINLFLLRLLLLVELSFLRADSRSLLCCAAGCVVCGDGLGGVRIPWELTLEVVAESDGNKALRLLLEVLDHREQVGDRLSVLLN